MGHADDHGSRASARLFSARADAFADELAPSFDGPRTLGLSLVRAGALFVRDAERDLERFGLTWTRFSALFVIGSQSPLALKDLPRLLGISRQACHAVVSRLESDDLVLPEKGTEGDRREVLLTLTADGRTLLKQAFAAHLEFVRRWFDVLDRQRVALLDPALSELVSGSATAGSDAAQTAPA